MTAEYWEDALKAAEDRADRAEATLRQIADAERAESADPLEWATWAHDLARASLLEGEEGEK